MSDRVPANPKAIPTPCVPHALEVLLADPELDAMGVPEAVKALMERGIWKSIINAYRAERMRHVRQLDLRSAVKLAKSYVKATKYRRPADAPRQNPGSGAPVSSDET